VTSIKLSDRQQFALLALDRLGTPVGGPKLAEVMTAIGRETSTAAAHQAANGLAAKKLAVKGYLANGDHIKYEITNEGRRVAARLRGAS